MYYRKGTPPRQAHVGIPEGTVEEEFGRRGFFGRVSHLYRTEAPTGWINIEGDLRPEAFNTEALSGLGDDDYIKGRIPMLFNNDVSIQMCLISKPMEYYFRNADGDDILFVHRGAGELETDFGPLQYEKGDYLVIPRGTVYKLNPTTETSLLIIESVGETELPDKGLLGRQALFDFDVVNVPSPVPVSESKKESTQKEWKLKIKRCDQITTLTYPFNPINTVSWKGDLTVWQLNIRDIRPISSERYHLPPSVHSTFVLRNAIICSFLPRPLETGDPKAIRVPFFHSNIDFDEVLFYHDGDFFSRKGIDSGMITFHPQGIHHGPQPGAKESAAKKTHTDEKAVMIDTLYPLHLSPQAKDICRSDYWKSWMGYLM